MTHTPAQVKERAEAVPFWFHSIDLGGGIVTRGYKTAEALQREWASFQVPPLAGKSVLDINAWDGWFAFQAERAGAASVTALDHYMWAMDLEQHNRYWKECTEQGIVPKPYHEMPYFQPDTLPGKKGFDTAHALLGSGVKTLVADFMSADLAQVGTYDVVFFLGSLYHMENPFESLKRVARVTRECAIVETEAVVVGGYEDKALCEFFEGGEMNNDVSNWWAPNGKALCGMCRAAGFSRAELVVGPSMKRSWFGRLRPRLRHYRAAVRAFK